jgi:hypothetical protein
MVGFSFTRSVLDKTTKTFDLTSLKCSDLSRGVMRHIRTRDATTSLKNLHDFSPYIKPRQ